MDIIEYRLILYHHVLSLRLRVYTKMFNTNVSLDVR